MTEGRDKWRTFVACLADHRKRLRVHIVRLHDKVLEQVAKTGEKRKMCQKHEQMTNEGYCQ